MFCKDVVASETTVVYTITAMLDSDTDDSDMNE